MSKLDEIIYKSQVGPATEAKVLKVLVKDLFIELIGNDWEVAGAAQRNAAQVRNETLEDLRKKVKEL